MLVPIDLWLAYPDGKVSGKPVVFVTFIDGNGCSVYARDILRKAGKAYLDLTKSYKNIDGYWIYDIQLHSGSIALTKEQGELYGLL